MISYLTDSFYYKNKHKDFIFKNSLYTWRVKILKNTVNIQKNNLPIKIRSIEHNQVIAIISKSNYRLLYDSKFLNIKNYYLPEEYNNKIKYIPDNKEIDRLHFNYIKRSYLSYLNYEKLYNLGLSRIEQFLIILAINGLKNFKIKDNLMIDKNYKIEEILEEKTIYLQEDKIQLIPFLYALQKKYNFNFQDLSKFILKLYEQLVITDPFDEDGFVFIKDCSDYPEISMFGKKLISQKIEIVFKKLKTNTKTIIIKNAKEDDFFMDYYSLQKNTYTVKEIISTKEDFLQINILWTSLKGIIPLKDFILTLKYLLKLDIIQEDKTFFIKEKIKENLNLVKNKAWLNKKIWLNIYSYQDFDFTNLLNEIVTKDISFVCPICNNEEFTTSPLNFMCKNRVCPFIFNRKTLKVVEVQSVSKEKMIEALSFKKIYIKNKNGQNFQVNLRNKKNLFFLSLK
jgi:hypothetical protein